MSFESGTATNFLDLLSKIVTFASANGWSVLEQSSTSVYMKGTGAAGLDEIYVGINATSDTANNRYNFELFGSIGYKAGRAYKDQPMSNGGGVFAYLRNDAIPYQLSVTGRRILCKAKIGTVYQDIHLGFINQNGTDKQYPYPLLIGGSGGFNTYNYATTADVASFWAFGNQCSCCGHLYLPSGRWGKITSTGANAALTPIAPYTPVWAKHESIITCPNETYMLWPIYMTCPTMPDILGAIDGLFAISGYNNAAENTLTIDGVDYTVFPDIYRSTYGAFCAMRMN